MVDDKVLETIRFHQDVIRKDLASSPLYQIREKEIEISGRVLAVRKQAETIVADARRAAAEAVAKVESETETFTREVEDRALRESEEQARQVLVGVSEDTADVDARVAANVAEAVETVVKAVTAG